MTAEPIGLAVATQSAPIPPGHGHFSWTLLGLIVQCPVDVDPHQMHLLPP